MQVLTRMLINKTLTSLVKFNHNYPEVKDRLGHILGKLLIILIQIHPRDLNTILELV